MPQKLLHTGGYGTIAIPVFDDGKSSFECSIFGSLEAAQVRTRRIKHPVEEQSQKK
jgi:hypothetical protein